VIILIRQFIKVLYGRVDVLRKSFVTTTVFLLLLTLTLGYRGQMICCQDKLQIIDSLASKTVAVNPENGEICIEFLNESMASYIKVYDPQFIFDIHKSGDLILAYTRQDPGFTTLLNASNIKNITLIRYVTGTEIIPNPVVNYSICTAIYMKDDLMVLSISPIPDWGPWFILLYNVSNPQEPTLLANTTIESTWYKGPDEIIRDFEIVGNNLFVLSGGYLSIFDISNVSSPVVMSVTELSFDIQDHFDLRPGFSEPFMDLKNLIVDGNYAYVITHIGDFIVLNISDLNNPAIIVSTHLPCMGYDALVTNNTLIVAGGIGGLYVFDISNKSTPTLISHYNETLRCSMGLDFFDNKTLVVADNIYGLHILNISDLHNIYELCNATSFDRLMDVVVDGNLIFGAEMLAGIHVYNVTNKTNVESVAYNPIPLFEWYEKAGETSITARPLIGGQPHPNPGEEFEIQNPYVETFFVDLQTLISRENKTFFKHSPFGTLFMPIIVYNDSDGNGRLSFRYETYPDNPYLIVRRVITDQVFFVANLVNVSAKFSELKNETWHGHKAYYYTFEITGLNFTNTSHTEYAWSYATDILEVIGNSAKGNTTLTFHIIPFENTNKDSPLLYDNVTIKVDVDLKLYDVDWGILPKNYCVAVGFLTSVWNDNVYYPVNSLSTSRGLSIRAMDVIGDFFVNKNYTAVNGSYIYNGTVNVSFDYAWGQAFYRNFEMADSHIIFTNFVGIPSNTTEIHYDPQISLYTLGKQSEALIRPYSGGEEQQPPPEGFELSPTIMIVIGIAAIFVIVVVAKFMKR